MSNQEPDARRDKGKDQARGCSTDAYHLAGWLLFVVCALFFIAAALRDGDLLILIGSILFLLACMVFLIPLFMSSNNRR